MEIRRLLCKRAIFLSRVFFCVAVIGLTMPFDAGAYVDPGTTGLLSQMLYVLFYGVLGVFFYFLRGIKQRLNHAKAFVLMLLGKRR